jgi:hypothetical protein
VTLYKLIVTITSASTFLWTPSAQRRMLDGRYVSRVLVLLRGGSQRSWALISPVSIHSCLNEIQRWGTSTLAAGSLRKFRRSRAHAPIACVATGHSCRIEEVACLGSTRKHVITQLVCRNRPAHCQQLSSCAGRNVLQAGCVAMTSADGSLGLAVMAPVDCQVRDGCYVILTRS